MKKLILGCVLVVALLLLFIGASGVRAQMKTIEDNGGVIVYGVVNATKMDKYSGYVVQIQMQSSSQ